jgi:aldehyde:ferredoxin oxidoreductase
VTREDLQAAVKRAFLRGLALELRQGYSKQEFRLPAEVTKQPNRNITLPALTTPEFLAELEKAVWDIFDRELQEL